MRLQIGKKYESREGGVATIKQELNDRSEPTFSGTYTPPKGGGPPCTYTWWHHGWTNLDKDYEDVIDLLKPLGDVRMFKLKRRRKLGI